MDHPRTLIIGGATRAATTSLFFHLAGHPDVNASTLKETRFFLDRDYPLKSKYRFEDGVHLYESFFTPNRPHALRLEATPDYLYSPGTPSRIAKHLPGAQMLFILRDPVDRLISWHRYARQRGLLPADTGFERYVMTQAERAKQASLPQHLRALEQGRYARYLRPWFDRFGPERILVLFFENLATQPEAAMERLCEFAGLDPSSLHTPPPHRNPSRPLRGGRLHAWYVTARFHASLFTHNKPILRQPLGQARHALEPLYFRLLAPSAQPTAATTPHPATLAALEDYYAPDARELQRLLGIRPPWSNRVSGQGDAP